MNRSGFTLIEEAPIPRHPGQSCPCDACSSELTKKKEKRNSFTRFERSCEVRPRTLWSAHPGWRVQPEGSAREPFKVVPVVAKAKTPSCEYRKNAKCLSLSLKSVR